MRRDTIVAIDPLSGKATKIGKTGQNTLLTGLATAHEGATGPDDSFYPAGTHFGLWRDQKGSDWVVRLDLTTGQTDKIVRTSRRFSGRGIAFGPGGKLFVIDSRRRLSWIDLTNGAVHDIGGTGYRSVSLEYNPSDGYLYAISRNNSLLRIDPANAHASLVGERAGLLGEGNYCTLVRTPEDNWYSVNTKTGELVQIDAASGQILAVVGALGKQSSGKICGMAVDRLDPAVLSAAQVAIASESFDEEISTDLVEAADEWTLADLEDGTVYLPLLSAGEQANSPEVTVQGTEVKAMRILLPNVRR